MDVSFLGGQRTAKVLASACCCVGLPHWILQLAAHACYSSPCPHVGRDGRYDASGPWQWRPTSGPTFCLQARSLDRTATLALVAHDEADCVRAIVDPFPDGITINESKVYTPLGFGEILSPHVRGGRERQPASPRTPPTASRLYVWTEAS